MSIPILGVIENMSYIQCGNCKEKIRVFSKKSAEEQARYLGVPLIKEMPIDIEFTESLEKGTVEEYINSKDYKDILHKII
jgi:Mrp family chromosome partitioning ATPase